MDQIKPHILIVDDVYINLHLLDHLLRHQGYDFSFAQSGEQVFEIMRQENIDLILLDVMLPGINGYEVCRKLKAEPRTQDIPVIFLTVKTEKDEIVRGFESGGVDYVSKPFNSAELIARIRTHLDLRGARQMALEFADRLAETNERLLLQNEQLQKASHEIESLKHLLAQCPECNVKLTDAQL
ncbi:MAG: response regulator [Desulfobacteraceae bacterium]|nr:response regulator [Desulfobacteraceae bacterium]